MAKDFPKLINNKKQVVLNLRYEESEDFAGTENHIIFLNGMFYNDTTITSKDYKKMAQKGFFVKGTTWKDIIFHELGHVISNIYHINSLEIAMNLLHTNIKANVACYVAENLSVYSAEKSNSSISENETFDGSEIISECFCAYYSKTNNEFAENFVKKCIKAIKEVEK